MPDSGAPDEYRIDVSSDNDEYKFLAMVPGDQTSYTHMNVRKPTAKPAGVTRYYRVFAVDAVHGAGAVSTAESATTKDLKKPAQVTPFTASSNDPEEVELSWTVPDDGGSPILGYCIRVWPTDTTPADGAEIALLTDVTCRDLFATEGPGKNPSIIPYHSECRTSRQRPARWRDSHRAGQQLHAHEAACQAELDLRGLRGEPVWALQCLVRHPAGGHGCCR